jgi:hypothetical protein
MKRGLAMSAAWLLPVWLVACQSARVPARISVTSLSLIVDATGPAHAMCQSFAPTPHDVSTFFRIATEVGGPEFHDRAVILPCRYEGTLTLDGEAWRFSINAGGAGLHGVMNAHLAAKLALNYLTPFIVSNAGLVAHRRN